jgi:hypothetical protein
MGRGMPTGNVLLELTKLMILFKVSTALEEPIPGTSCKPLGSENYEYV